MKVKRLIGLGMSVIMAFSSLSVSMAEDDLKVTADEIEEEETVTEVTAEDDIESGQIVGEESVSLYAVSSTDTMYEVDGGYIYFDESTGTITDCDESVIVVDIPGEINGVKVTNIGEYAFSECTNLMSLTIPEGVTTIRNGAFYMCSSLTKLVVPASVTTIECLSSGKDSYVFDGCSGLETAGPIGSGCNYEFGWEESIPSNAFWDCMYLNSITIPDGVKSIGDDAFRGCESLEKITIPDSVTNIGSMAFYGCSLKSLVLSANLKSIDGFTSCSYLTTVIIPEGAISICDSAFRYCSRLNGIVIPDSVTEIGNWAFEDSDNVTIYCNAGSYAETYAKENNIPYSAIVKYEAEGGYIYFDEDTGTVWGCDAGVTFADIPSEINGVNVTSIKRGAFNNCGDIISIILPEGVTDIDFYECNALESIIIPGSVISIGEDTFSWCGSLKSVTLLDGVTSIGDWAFQACNNLYKVEIPGSCESIGAHAFDGCESLISVDIPEGVKSIGYAAFRACYGLESVTIPGSATGTGNSAFEACNNLKNVTISEGVTSIDDYSFGECSSLESIIIPESVTSIGKGAFWECSNLESITILSSVTSIDENTFLGNDNYSGISENATVYCYRGSTADNTSLYPDGVTIVYIGEEDSDVTENIAGDIDGDNIITSTDATYVLLYTVGLSEISGSVLEAADLDGDGQVTSTDATYVLLKAVSLRDF